MPIYVPASSPSRGGDVTCLLPLLFLNFIYSVLVSVSVFMALSTLISLHKFSRQLFAFSLCSSGFNSAILVLSIIYLFMKVSLSPDVILVG